MRRTALVINLRRLILVALAAALFIATAAPFIAQRVSAAFELGYFTGLPFVGSTFNVLNDGIPSGTDKGGMVGYIESLYRNSPWNSADYVGSAYIIQTMRGTNDHNWPDEADIADWKAKVFSPSITFSWEHYSAAKNTARFYNNGARDVSRYDGDGAAYYSMVFRNSSGSVVYVIKQICGNPLGSLPGLPNPINFDLEPTINASPDSSEGGSQVTLAPSVNNTGSTSSTSVQWQLTRFVVPANVNPPPRNPDSSQTPVQYYGNGAQVIQSGTRVFNRGVNAIPANPYALEDLPVGTKVCFALSVQPRSHTTSNWRHGTPDCVVISKKPKVQILGSDLFVGKNATSRITTSSTTKNVSGTNRTFGSWGEYGVAASGAIVGMASGAGYSGGGTSSLFCDVSFLTFTSAGNGSCTPSSAKGSYVMNKALPDISARLVPRASLGANPTVNVTTTATNVYSATGNVSITSSGQVSAGRWVIINAPTATVTIRDNIIYTNGGLTTIRDIPQVVIVANDIRIEGDVTQVDAWLIATGASGNLVTCSDVASANQLRANNCNQRLTVNGPVVARHLFLYRTAGAGVGAQTGSPAEVFNLRPDAYLWATAFSADAGRLQTVSTQELPPRF